MIPDAVLIQRPAADLDLLLSLTQKALGYSIVAGVDAGRKKHSPADKFLSCLCSFQERNAVAFHNGVLGHVSYSVLMVADERDLLDILSIADGMHFLVADTVSRGVMAAVLTGSLNQWQSAVVQGMSKSVETNVRASYGKIMRLLEGEGLSDVWRDYHTKPSADHTFLLEHHRNG